MLLNAIHEEIGTGFIGDKQSSECEETCLEDFFDTFLKSSSEEESVNLRIFKTEANMFFDALAENFDNLRRKFSVEQLKRFSSGFEENPKLDSVLNYSFLKPKSEYKRKILSQILFQDVSFDELDKCKGLSRFFYLVCTAREGVEASFFELRQKPTYLRYLNKKFEIRNKRKNIFYSALEFLLTDNLNKDSNIQIKDKNNFYEIGPFSFCKIEQPHRYSSNLFDYFSKFFKNFKESENLLGYSDIIEKRRERLSPILVYKNDSLDFLFGYDESGFLILRDGKEFEPYLYFEIFF